MENTPNIFLKKKILVYGLGKSGLSALKFLLNKCEVHAYDDFKNKFKSHSLKKKLIKFNKISSLNFDQIILSPGININNCKLSNYLKKNKNKIYTDLDVFYSFNKNFCITITGTNGKSTSSKLLYEILKNQRFDVRLVGNIGNPILSVKNINQKTIFVIEASSYQLEYSKIFKSKFAVILNLSPDHIERHKTLNNYIKSKFKLLKNQSKNNLAFVKKNDFLISKQLKKNNFKSKIIKVDTKKIENYLKDCDNKFFSTEHNKENLSFIIEISKRLKLNKIFLKKTIQKFKGLQYRQQIIFKNKYLTIINDSKSTSFSSSIGVLKANYNIYWLIGGVHKKGDKFILPKKYYKNIKAFIYGKNKKFFNQNLYRKIKIENFDNLKDALKKVFMLIKKQRLIHKTILFSPCAASFDNFKNFEDRGFYFNKLIKRHLNEI